MNRKHRGFLLAILSAILWGLSGNITEYIFQISNISSFSLASARMFLAGIILTIFMIARNDTVDFLILKNDKKEFFQLILYSILGVIGTQLPFFTTIKYSSAALATLLQFLTPILIIFYVVIFNRVKPKKIEIIVTFLAFIGVYLILTNGNFRDLQVSKKAIFWGFLAAIGFAYYLLGARAFKLSKIAICSFSMLIGGFIVLPIINYSVLFANLKNGYFVLALLANVILGTVIPFYTFLKSLEFIPPRTTSLLGCFEPLTAMLISYLLFNVVLQPFQLLGAGIIIVSVIVLSL